MRYRDFVQTYFLIDEPKSGQLVPFTFRPVQNKFYDELVRDYDIEKKGLNVPVRELILKARREGFSSLILALFAADDILSENPTETLVISYKDDATKTFRKRYRTFVTSYGARKLGHSVEDIQRNPGLMEQAAKQLFSVDADEIELKHNHAHFYCGTASARTGGRGGVVQKLLFSEAAFYPDKKELRAKEIIEGTLRQVDLASGWAFVESTANGDVNHYAKMWVEAATGESRFKARFYGWREMYTQEEFDIICSEFTDKRMIKQEYPETAEEAFLSSGERFFDPAIIQNIQTTDPQKVGDWNYYGEFVSGHRYALGVDVAEGVGRHNSTIVVIDFDNQDQVVGRIIKTPKVVAVYASNRIKPDTLAHEIRNGAVRYGNCLAAIERNNHGFATLATIKGMYFNLYKDESDNLGWHTNMASKPRMLHDLRTALHEGSILVPDETLKRELISLPAGELNDSRFDEEDETRGHFDRVIALAIAWQMRALAQPSMAFELRDREEQAQTFEKYGSPFNEI